MELERALAQLPDDDRAAIVADVSDHIRAQLTDGVGIEQVLADLGPTEDVASAAFDRPDPAHLDSQDQRWWTPTRVAQLIGATLFAAAGLVIAFVPLGTEVTEEATSHGRVLSNVQNTTLADDVGWYGVMVFISVPMLLAVVPMLLRGQAHRSATIAAAVIAAPLCLLALASIGFFFLPGVLALIAAACLLALRSKLPNQAAIYHQHPAT